MKFFIRNDSPSGIEVETGFPALFFKKSTLSRVPALAAGISPQPAVSAPFLFPGKGVQTSPALKALSQPSRFPGDNRNAPSPEER